MENILLLYLTILTIVLGFAALQARSSDESMARRFARVRVPVDGRRRGPAPEPPEDDVETARPAEIWILAMLVLLVLILLANAV
jgi:hypothetical protein